MLRRLTFEFDIGEKIRLKPNSLLGEVVGLSSYKTYPNTFCIRYITKDELIVEDWFNADEIDIIPKKK